MWIHDKRLHWVPYIILLSLQMQKVAPMPFQWWASITGGPDALCRVTMNAVLTGTYNVTNLYILPRMSAVAKKYVIAVAALYMNERDFEINYGFLRYA